MSHLKIEAVTKRYSETVALDGVSLEVPAGKRTAIVGPSGSGKTSLLRQIAGFEAPDAGRILLDGQVLAEAGRAVPPHLRDIGYVTQEGALFPHISVAGNIGFGMAQKSREKILQLLQQVGLPVEMAERRPHQLSGGQQQRVALARAMARAPKIMLLDEPFSALDTGLRDAMRDMVGAVLGEAGITTILVTHDQSEALSFADHVAVMREGRLVQATDPQTLYLHPSDPQTARFLGEAIILPANVRNGLAETVLGMVSVGAADGQHMVMLRPEQLQLGPAAGAETQGVVISRRFEGSRWRLVVEHIPQAAGIDIVQTSRVFTAWVPGTEAVPVGSVFGIQITGAAHVFEDAAHSSPPSVNG